MHAACMNMDDVVYIRDNHVFENYTAVIHTPLFNLRLILFTDIISSAEICPYENVTKLRI